MGLFSRKELIDPRYFLPKASNWDCYKYQRISRYEFPMMNMAYLEKTLQQGLAPDTTAAMIEESWNWSPDVDVDLAATVLAEDVFRYTPEIAFTDTAANAYAADIAFGVLAGIFERRSGQHRKGLRHPAVWNALSIYTRALENEDTELTDDQKALRFATPHLGYTHGIEPATPVAVLFSRWNA